MKKYLAPLIFLSSVSVGATNAAPYLEGFDDGKAQKWVSQSLQKTNWSVGVSAGGNKMYRATPSNNLLKPSLNYWMVTSLYEGYLFQDFKYAVSMRNSGFGKSYLVFRASADFFKYETFKTFGEVNPVYVNRLGTGYAFSVSDCDINDRARYELAYYDNDNPELIFRDSSLADKGKVVLASGELSKDAVKCGNRWNRLAVQANGEEISLSVNGELVDAVVHIPNGGVQPGRIGVQGATARNDPTIHNFDRISVSAIAEQIPAENMPRDLDE